MSDDTHYTVLGVPETATELEIKVAYRNLLKRIHPDTVATLSPDLKREADVATKEIIHAYSVLSRASERRRYDRELSQSRLKAVRPPATADVPRGQPVQPQTRPAPRRSRRRRLHHHGKNPSTPSRLRRWAYRHPALAGLLVAVLSVILMLLVWRVSSA